MLLLLLVLVLLLLLERAGLAEPLLLQERA
jgi:hypothetical protein